MPEIEPGDATLKTLKGLHLWHAPMSSCSQRVRIVLAETGQEFESHLVNLEADEHATPEYQAIHPNGLVPALVDDGHLFIESVDIIARMGGTALPVPSSTDLLDRADAAQADLKLLTFEFLFRMGKPKPPEAIAAFQASHKNDALRQFRLDFAAGFDPDRINAAIARTDDGFRHLDQALSDGRAFFDGAEFTVLDVAWMPNVHRFSLMDWPFDRTPHLARWFERVAQRPSYRTALLDWQNENLMGNLAAYTRKRQADGTDIRSTPHLKAGD